MSFFYRIEVLIGCIFALYRNPLTDGHLNMGGKGNTHPFSQLLRYSILLSAVPEFVFGIS